MCCVLCVVRRPLQETVDYVVGRFYQSTHGTSAGAEAGKVGLGACPATVSVVGALASQEVIKVRPPYLAPYLGPYLAPYLVTLQRSS